MAAQLKAADERYGGKAAFVGILSNGTSGNINNFNFGSLIRLKRNPGEQINLVAKSVADAAMGAYESIKWDAAVKLDTVEEDRQLNVREANSAELVQNREILEKTPKDKDGQWSDRKATYACESLNLADYPDEVPVKLKVHRINSLRVAAIPCEVFVEIGLDLKKTSPFTRHFTISLANG